MRQKIKRFKWLLVLTVLLTAMTAALSACSSSSGSGTTASDDSGGDSAQATFNSGGSLGELLTYTINTDTLAYSYNIVASEFGLDDQSGSGTLTKYIDGFVYDADGSVLILLPNALLVGGVDLNGTTMLFTGVPQITGSYSASEIVGTYNYINYECGDSLSGTTCTAGYSSEIGTFKVNADGTWGVCAKKNYDSASPDLTGTWEDKGNGLIEISYGGSVIGTIMLLPSSNGGKVLVADLKDRPGLGAGPGLLVGVKQESVASEDLSGTYHYFDTEESYERVTISGDTFNTTGGSSGSFERDKPWTGWLTTTDDGSGEKNYVLVLPGDGVFLITDDGATTDEGGAFLGVGGKQPTS